jgi:hypothetical protein
MLMRLILNDPSRFASSLMAIKETCASVSFTILAPPIKTVDLILRCLSSLSWHKRMQSHDYSTVQVANVVDHWPQCCDVVTRHNI